MSAAHDAEGQPVEVGDPVMIPGCITSINGESHNNIAVATELPMFPGGGKTLLTLNSNQIKKAKTPVSKAPATAPQKK